MFFSCLETVEICPPLAIALYLVSSFWGLAFRHDVLCFEIAPQGFRDGPISRCKTEAGCFDSFFASEHPTAIDEQVSRGVPILSSHQSIQQPGER
jgi:hypothetical protein